VIDLEAEVIPLDLGTMRRSRSSATTASGTSEGQRAGTLVRFEGVHKRYGRVQALSGVDAEFRPGRIAAILGPNGAGKTTLMKILLGLVRPDEGRVRLGERVVSGDAEYRHQIGYMPQLPRFPGSMSGRELADLLTDLRDYRGEPDDELVEVFGLEGDLDKPFRALSGGTRQKVNAALAFRYRAPVLVLDEPTAGLDPVAARLLKDKVRGERDRGRTVLLTSHDLGQVESLADDIVFLLDGRVRFAGALDGLLDATRQDDLEAAVAHLLVYGRFEVVT
jgi:Cu-processing system ATP-binding protein